MRNTKDNIINSAIELFSVKGFTETSARDIAGMVGIKESSIYNHFASKSDILNQIIAEYEDFVINSTWLEWNLERFIGMKGSMGERLSNFMVTNFPKDKEERFLKIMYIVLHEQYRNESVRRFVVDLLINGTKINVGKFVTDLYNAGFIEPIDKEIIATLQAAIIYFFLSCHNLGIVDSSPDYDGLTMTNAIKLLYSTFLKPTDLLKRTIKESG